MNDIITDREDLFWAKMAGRDVDITTMTPPVAASVREKLMLETAQRIGQGGGGSDNDFIIEAELSVDIENRTFAISDVEMDINDIFDAIASNKNVRLIAINESIPIRVIMDVVQSQTMPDSEFLLFTGIIMGFDGIMSAFDAYAYSVKDSDPPAIRFDLGVSAIPRLSDIPMIMIVNASMDADTRAIISASASLSDVVDAYREGNTVEFNLFSTKNVDGVIYNMYRTLSNSVILYDSTSGAQAEFYETVLDLADSGKAKIIRVMASDDEQNGAWQYDETELTVSQP